MFFWDLFLEGAIMTETCIHFLPGYFKVRSSSACPTWAFRSIDSCADGKYALKKEKNLPHGQEEEETKKEAKKAEPEDSDEEAP